LECSRRAATKYAELFRGTRNLSPSKLSWLLRCRSRGAAAAGEALFFRRLIRGRCRCGPQAAACTPRARRPAFPLSRLAHRPCPAPATRLLVSCAAVCMCFVARREVLRGGCAWPQQGHARCAVRPGATARRPTNIATSTSRMASSPSTSSRSGRGQRPRPRAQQPRRACPTGGSCSPSRPSSTAGTRRVEKPPSTAPAWPTTIGRPSDA
jgi:hypothetical protein